MTSYRRMDRSALLVPGDNPWTPVAGTLRGALAQHLYHSAVTNDEREFYVYTPPGYDSKRRHARANSRIRLLWIGIGGDDPSVVATEQLNAYLDSRGVKYTYKVSPNEPHWWPLWHRQWAEFAQLIFK
jgi:esterase/lipase superfamily enzyme